MLLVFEGINHNMLCFECGCVLHSPEN